MLPGTDTKFLVGNQSQVLHLVRKYCEYNQYANINLDLLTVLILAIQPAYTIIRVSQEAPKSIELQSYSGERWALVIDTNKKKVKAYVTKYVFCSSL